LALRGAAETGKLATDNVAIANVSRMDRRDIMLISRFLSAKIECEVRRAVADLRMAQPALIWWYDRTVTICVWLK
jgi:hypothetical protein